MKRFLFLFISALLAGTTYASNLSKDVIAMVTSNHEVSITEQGQSLILEQSSNVQMDTIRTARIHHIHRTARTLPTRRITQVSSNRVWTTQNLDATDRIL